MGITLQLIKIMEILVVDKHLEKMHLKFQEMVRYQTILKGYLNSLSGCWVYLKNKHRINVTLTESLMLRLVYC